MAGLRARVNPSLLPPTDSPMSAIQRLLWEMSFLPGVAGAAPLKFIGWQSRVKGDPFPLFNLIEDIPGVGRKGMTLAGDTLEKLGLQLPKIPPPPPPALPRVPPLTFPQ